MPQTQPTSQPTANNTGFLDELRNSMSQKYEQTSIPSYPKASVPLEDQINQLPNSDKLSAGERWIYKTLPGVTETKWGKILMNFADSPAGKVLSWLDVGAEALERTIGLVPQLGQMAEDGDWDLKNAWAAGTLFWDTTNLPRLERDENGKLRFQIDSNLPGSFALNEVRQKLKEGQNIEDIRSQYYTNLGALALRAQLNDTWGHVLGDPLSLALGAVKPVQRLQAVRNLALSTKVAPELVQAQIQAAKLAGNLEDVARFEQVLADASKTGKALTKFEKFAINITGGQPWLTDVTKMTSKQKMLQKLNPFALTPQARASELMDIVAANIGEYVVRPNWNKDPEAAIAMLAGIQRGAIGQQWGHAAFTIQGRTIQSFTSHADIVGKVGLQEWRTLAKERTLFGAIAEVLGKDIRKVWKHAGTDSNDLMKQILAKIDPNANNILAQELRSGRLTPETLGQYARSITSDTPLDNHEFYAKLMVQVQDAAMQQAIIRFGVTEKGFLTKLADTAKAWETIPFIKANPANAFRNIVNNEMTLIGRGVHGVMTDKQIHNFWKGKYIPPQFTRAFGFGTADEFDTSLATKRLTEALMGKETFLDRAKAAAGKFSKATGLDNTISKVSQASETAASRRATTVAWMEFHQKYWNARTGFVSFSKHVNPAVLRKIEQTRPDLARVLDDLAESAGADPEKFARMMQEGLENSPASIMKSAADKLNYDFKDVIGSELMDTISAGLPQAIKNNNVREFLSGIRTQMENHVDDLFNKNVAELPGIIKAQVQAGGQQQYYKVFSQATDEMWGSHTEHAFRMSSLNDMLRGVREAKDFEKANALWNKILTDSDAHFNRMWKKFEAYQDGLSQGAKAAGIPYPAEVKASFGNIRKGWQNYFTTRNTMMKEFFEARLKGKERTVEFDQIQAKLNAMYKKQVMDEDAISSQIDDIVGAGIDDPDLRTAYTNFRDTVAQLKKQDKESVVAFYEQLQSVNATEGTQMWQKFWQDRTATMERIRQVENFGSAMLQGDPNAVRMFSQTTQTAQTAAQAAPEGQAFNILDEFNRAGIATATKTGNRNNVRILNTIKKYTGQKFDKIEDIPEDVARAALEARAAEKGTQVPGQTQSFLPDVEKYLPTPVPLETALSQLNYGRGYAVLDAIEEAGLEAVGKATTKFKSLDPDIQKAIAQWQDAVGAEMSGFRSAATQYSLFRRDSALLNYNRRTNFDSWLGNVAPFAFWTTHSVMNWAVHSIDRPAMAANYFRTRKNFETAGLQGQHLPKRLKGHIRLNLPFVPDWMGDTFTNPLRVLLPFDNFMMPWEQSAQSALTLDGKTQRTLETMLDSGEIDEAEYQDALASKKGDAWEIAQSRASEGGDQYDAMDFVSMTMTPHAPLMWAYNVARGTPNEIGAFTPMTRTAKNLAAVMGVEDWSNSPYNIEARMRKEMGLNAYDKWDDYRIGREISNMAGDGSLSPEEAAEAMQIASLVESGQLDSGEAYKMNKFYAEAVKRSNLEFAGGTPGAILGILGIPIKAFPVGEENQRKLSVEFGEAYEKYDAANKAFDKFLKGREPSDDLIRQWEAANPQLAKDSDALTKFFEEHPEYETRLALFKKPEERLKNFMIDNMWARWQELPKLTQDEMKDQMGSAFSDYFVNKQTRNYDAITNEQLQIWLKLTGGKQVGFLSATDEALIELNELSLTDPETAERVQVFYDRRNFDYDGWYEMQNKYYTLPEGAERKKYVRENPELKMYWDFRRKFMTENPDLVKYLTDDPKQLAKAAEQRRNPDVAIPTAQEIRQVLSPSMQNLLVEYEQEGQPLPFVVRQNLDLIAQHYNLTGEQVLDILTAQP